MNLEAMIVKRFAPPEYATFLEVADGTGAAARRRADAIAMGIWPSRGLRFHGFECKESRSDWLREKKTPEKAESIARFCDHWWLVVRDDKIVQDGELPTTWGLLVARGGRLVVAKEAPKLEAQPLSRSFIAAMLRKVPETTVPKASVQELVEERVKAQLEMKERQGEDHATQLLRNELEALQSNITLFEQASGVKIDRWQGASIGAAVKAFLDWRFVSASYEAAFRSAERFVQQYKEVTTEIAKVVGEPEETVPATVYQRALEDFETYRRSAEERIAAIDAELARARSEAARRRHG